jgi:hypothetical protein
MRANPPGIKRSAINGQRPAISDTHEKNYGVLRLCRSHPRNTRRISQPPEESRRSRAMRDWPLIAEGARGACTPFPSQTALRTKNEGPREVNIFPNNSGIVFCRARRGPEVAGRGLREESLSLSLESQLQLPAGRARIPGGTHSRALHEEESDRSSGRNGDTSPRRRGEAGDFKPPVLD